MFTKVGILALCAAASFNEVTAAAHHRHRHPKREIVYAETDTVIVTEYETHTVYAGEEPTATAAVPTPVEIEAEKAVSTSSQEQTTPVVTPTTTDVPPAPATPTTLATLVKPSSVVDIPVVSQAAAIEVAPAKDTPTSTQAAAPAEVATTTTAPVAVETTTSAPAVVETTTSAPTTTTSAPATTSAATPSTSGGKRGAAYNDVTMLTALLGKTDAISWIYNWGYDAGDLNVDVPYYPTMWGDKFAADWPAAAEAAIAKGTEFFFSMNEPDNAGQANMAPAYAAAKYQEWMNPYAGQVKIAAPAISSSQSPNQGIDWLNQFFDACGGKCQVDFCNAHWYGPGGESGADLFLTHLKAVRDAEGCQGKPVWVTEFMPMGSATENETFLKTVIEALESSDYDFVEKYSYFMVAQGDSYLMSSETELNTLGNIYAGLS